MTAPLLAVDGLCVFYGDAQALDEVSISIDQGEILAIVGANGAGKTSLIRAIAGLLPICAGSVRFAGEEIAGRSSASICNLGVGQVAEGRQIFPSMSVRENLEVAGLLPRARAGARAMLDTVFGMFPKLAQRSTQAAGTLSGGEQQMLAIGRCLMGAPRLIMFDEPSLGLAPAIVQEVFQTIVQLHEHGMTIILVEQNVAASLRIAGSACVLENGRVALRGTGEQLLHDPRVREAYLGL